MLPRSFSDMQVQTVPISASLLQIHVHILAFHVSCLETIRKLQMALHQYDDVVNECGAILSWEDLVKNVYFTHIILPYTKS